jgi:predicted nucleic acid-binding protein
MSQIPLVYVDTNIFTAYLISNPQSRFEQSEQAERFFNDIQQGKYSGITSTITQLEFLGNAKRIISQLRKKPIQPFEETISMSTFDSFLDQVGIGFVDVDILLYDPPLRIFSNCLRIVRGADPVSLRPFSNDWKMIKSVDSISLHVAIQCKAKLFATFDRGFSGLRNQPILPFIISEQY